MLSYIQLILLLSSSLTSPITTTSTYTTLFNAFTLVLIVALPFLISYYTTPIRIETALFDTSAIDAQINSLLVFDSDDIFDDADLSATVDDGYFADESDLDDLPFDADNSCIDLELHRRFRDNTEAEDAWEAMKAAAGCGGGSCHRLLSSTQPLTPFTVPADREVAAEDSEETIVDKEVLWTPGSKDYNPKKAKAELAPFADERYFSDSESDSDDDDEGSMIDPFDITDNYDAGDDKVPRAGFVLGNTKDLCKWYECPTFDEPTEPFTLEPTCDKNIDGTPVVDEEGDEDEEVAIEDVWGYHGAEDELGNVCEGFKALPATPRRLKYNKTLWPARARELYAAWWET